MKKEAMIKYIYSHVWDETISTQEMMSKKMVEIIKQSTEVWSLEIIKQLWQQLENDFSEITTIFTDRDVCIRLTNRKSLMFGDIIDYLEPKLFTNVEYSKLRHSLQLLWQLWKNKKTAIQHQDEECVYHVYNEIRILDFKSKSQVKFF